MHPGSIRCPSPQHDSATDRRPSLERCILHRGVRTARERPGTAYVTTPKGDFARPLLESWGLSEGSFSGCQGLPTPKGGRVHLGPIHASWDSQVHIRTIDGFPSYVLPGAARAEADEALGGAEKTCEVKVSCGTIA